MKLLRAALACSALMLALSTVGARADVLYVGSPYNNIAMDYAGGVHGAAFSNQSYGGGNVQNSTLNAAALDYLYCVHLFTPIAAPASYPDTVVTTNGVIGGVLVNNAGEVEWLMDTYADLAASDTNLQMGLQAAIWSVVTPGLSLGSAYGVGNPVRVAYEGYLAALPSGGSSYNPSDWYWLTPKTGTTVYQGMIGGPSTGGSGIVPEPGAITLLLSCAAPLALVVRKRVRRG